MISIHILVRYSPLWGGFFLYNPLLKWKKEFKKEGINFTFFTSHLNSRIYNCDVLIVDYRYFEQIIKGNFKPSGFKSDNLDFLYQILEKARNEKIKCVLFDTSDASGTRCNQLIPYFDIWLKKQAFADVTRYSRNGGENPARIWMPDEIPEIDMYKLPPINAEELKKLRIGWNLGLCDYHPMKLRIMDFFPINLTYFVPKLFNELKFVSPDNTKELLFSYRGKISNNNIRYNYNRMILYNTLSSSFSNNRWNAIFGERIPRRQYLSELAKSKAALSPYGWGEICYRDFEIFLNGCLLIKPDMGHVKTYPDYYIPHNTYLPVQWDYKDLPDLLDNMNSDFSPFIQIVKNAQQLFKFHNEDSHEFITHFKKQILS